MKTTIIALVSSIITGVAGYLLKYFLDRKQSAASASAELKRDMYQGYVESILDFYQNPNVDQTTRNAQFRKANMEFQKANVLDVSPSVLRAIRRQHAFFKKAQDRGVTVDGRMAIRKNTRIFKMMRRDIGTSNWGLGWSAAIIFSPVLMYSYQEVVHPLWWRVNKLGHRVWRRLATPIMTKVKSAKAKVYAWAAAD